jgi:hypothetical protein
MTLPELIILLLIGILLALALQPGKTLNMLLTRIADTARRLFGFASKTATPELVPPTPDRYELVLDDTGDYGIRDTETGLIADYMERTPDVVRLDVIRLNSGDLDPEDAYNDFEPEEVLFPPYVVV